MQNNELQSKPVGGARPKIRFNNQQNQISNSKNRKSNEVNGKKSDSEVNALDVAALDNKFISILENGIHIRRAAFSKEWIENRCYVSYIRPPMPVNEKYIEGAFDAWFEHIQYFKEDLLWLLNLSHHKFWSQIAFDKHVKRFLQSYLTHCFRWYELSENINREVDEMQTSIYGLILRIFIRLSTFKESNEDFITQSFFGEILYQKSIIDVCTLLDLSVLYGASNKNLLSKMITNIFKSQPKFQEDLINVMTLMSQVFLSIEQKLFIFEAEVPDFAISELNSTLNSYEVLDISHYILDTVSSLQIFLSLYPKACTDFYESGCLVRLASFYERIVPNLTKRVEGSCEFAHSPELLRGFVSNSRSLYKNIEIIRSCALKLFRDVLSYVCLNDDAEYDTGRRLEIFSEIITWCASEKTFLCDMTLLFGFEEDVKYFEKKLGHTESLDFVKEILVTIKEDISTNKQVNDSLNNCLEARNGINDSFKTKNVFNGSLEARVGSNDSLEAKKQVNWHLDDCNYINDGFENDFRDNSLDYNSFNASAAGVEEDQSQLSSIEIYSMVSSIKDLLPDLKDNYVIKCLKYFNFNNETTLNALLDNSVPHAVHQLSSEIEDNTDNFGMNLSNSGTLSKTKNNSNLDLSNSSDKNWAKAGKNSKKKHQKEDVLTSRRNVYDNDEFDIFNNPSNKIDASKISKGKSKNQKEVQKDPEFQKKLKSILHQYEERGGTSIYEDELKYTSMYDGNYADEYDDTYDDTVAAADDAYDSKKLSSLPNIRGQGALNAPGQNFGPEDSESEEDSGSRSNTKLSFEPFCENPEITRQRYEQKRMNKQQNRPVPSENNLQIKTRVFDNSSIKKSGKSWRQNESGEEQHGSKGGKYKEDTNHGKTQNKTYKQKMVHKGQNHKAAAQYKYRGNF